jgi:nicotinate-nucleotide adenylyltransferase
MVMKKCIILFGGSFDPIHNGHVEVARVSTRKLCAEKVIFIPANRSPHKPENTYASAQHRYEMVRLAVSSESVFDVSDYEVNRPGPSYTLDTVKYFEQQYSYSCLFFLIGADTIGDLHKWHRIDELFKHCTLCTMCRGGFEKPDFTALKNVFTDEMVNTLRDNIIETPLIDVSSSHIRKMLMGGQSADEYLSPLVAEYIRKNNLYVAV